MGKPSRYHLLSIAAKRQEARDKMREPPLRCPNCETSLQPADMFAHLDERCTGRAEPHACAQWVSWTEAKRFGVPAATVGGWVNRGLVQSRGPKRARQYLLRDIARLVALRALWARTKSER